MDRTHAVRQRLLPAPGAVCPAVVVPTAVGSATSVDAETRVTGRGALHGHG